MSGQLNLLAPASEEPVEVPTCTSVLLCGASARERGGSQRPLFAHRHVPPAPVALGDESAWLAALDFAEEELRFKQAPVAILDLDRGVPTGCSGGRAGPGIPRLSSSSQGIAVDGALASWPQLLRARREQRGVEFGLARARDLAEAYHYLAYYGRVYGEPEERDGFDGVGEQWSPVPLIEASPKKRSALAATPPSLRPTPPTCARGSNGPAP